VQYRASLDLEQHLDLIRELMMRMDVPVTLTVLDDVFVRAIWGMMFGNVMMLLLLSELD
jgi:urease accessory protein